MLVVVDEFTREWLGRLEVAPLFIEPGSPWDNGYVESVNARLRDEFLDGEIFYTLKEVQALGYRPPAPEARDWPLAASREDKQPAIH